MDTIIDLQCKLLVLGKNVGVISFFYVALLAGANFKTTGLLTALTRTSARWLLIETPADDQVLLSPL